MSEWRDMTLGDVCILRAGNGFKRDEQGASDGDMPFIKVSDMNLPGNRSRVQESNNWVSFAQAQRLKLKPFGAGTSVFAKIGEALKQNRVRLLTRDTVIDNNMMGALPRSGVVDPTYFYYLMSSVDIAATATGTALPYLTVSTLTRVPVRVPGLGTQAVVGAVLESIDHLIENNRRRVEVLEEMARAIYREWFVKFRYPGHQDVPVVDSALGPIPEGWQVSTLSAISDVTMGQSPKSEYYNDGGIGKPFHQGVAEFGRHFPTTRKWCSVEGRSASDGDILISVRAPVGRINVADTDITIGRGLAAVRAKDGRQGLLLGHLREAFAVEDSMGNDGAIFKSIGKAEFASIPVVAPPDALADLANASLTENFGMIRALSHSTQRLTSIRDLLLPKLVTGQIDVSSLDLGALREGQVA